MFFLCDVLRKTLIIDCNTLINAFSCSTQIHHGSQLLARFLKLVSFGYCPKPTLPDSNQCSCPTLSPPVVSFLRDNQLARKTQLLSQVLLGILSLQAQLVTSMFPYPSLLSLSISPFKVLFISFHILNLGFKSRIQLPSFHFSK